MRVFKLMALVAIAAPGIAMAQIGPNPAVNGSLDPTVGKTGDPVTAPEDAPIRPGGPEGDVLAEPAAPSDTVSDTPPSVPTASAPEAASDTKMKTAPTSESKRKPR